VQKDKEDDDDGDEDDDEDIIIVKFYNVPIECLPNNNTSSSSVNSNDDNNTTNNNSNNTSGVTSPEFGYVPTPQTQQEQDRRRSQEMPPIHELLTILVTTSPIKSNPSTELIEYVFNTFQLGGGYDFAVLCKKVIVCDGYRETVVKEDGTTNTAKYGTTKQAMRNGIVSSDQKLAYEQYKQNLKMLCVNAAAAAAGGSEDDQAEPPSSPFVNTQVYELPSRHGYGFAVKHVLQNTELVTTPYVIVIQHDRTFMRPTPIRETLKAMYNNLHIKYVGMTMRSNLLYLDQVSFCKN
jgi:hypothetical protein